MTSGNKNLKSLAGLFLKLGITAFGGPAAHIALMQKEVIDKRGWMDHQHFLDLIGATNLIPGPNSTEMAIHIGHERGGWKGLLIAGCSFILPAVIITGLIAWLYQLYGQLPQVNSFFYGIKPAIIAIILGAVYPLAKKAIKSIELAIIGVFTLIAVFSGVNEIYAMFGAGIITLMLFIFRKPGPAKAFLPISLLQISTSVASNARIFFIFLKIGAILYGSGYVLFAFLDNELVAKGLLSRKQLIDAIAIGQFTPGPVFSSVTFIGWQMNGLYGAALATMAVFLPSFVFVAFLNPLVPQMRKSKLFSAFLDGINVASIALILAVCISFSKETITDWRTILIAFISLIVTFGFRKVNSVFIIIGGSLLGYILKTYV
jgi:chromate transporter